MLFSSLFPVSLMTLNISVPKGLGSCLPLCLECTSPRYHMALTFPSQAMPVPSSSVSHKLYFHRVGKCVLSGFCGESEPILVCLHIYLLNIYYEESTHKFWRLKCLMTCGLKDGDPGRPVLQFSPKTWEPKEPINSSDPHLRAEEDWMR